MSVPSRMCCIAIHTAHLAPSCPHMQVCKYIDIPLQHISNLTLLGMNRPPQAHTVALLRTLRERIPGLALRTTFISGFPGVGWAADWGRGEEAIGGLRGLSCPPRLPPVACTLRPPPRHALP